VFDFQPEEREREQELPVGTLIDGGWCDGREAG
jgi:hypothetical protein